MEPAGEPVEVNTHDFPSQARGQGDPVRGLRPRQRRGLGERRDHERHRQFAAELDRRLVGKPREAPLPDADTLTITADCGGSNNPHPAMEDRAATPRRPTGLQITVCHFPPGTSKWNKIEHRLFSFISLNWRGKPLTSHRTVINLIAATTTNTGLKVYARLDEAATARRSSHRRATRRRQHHTHAFHGDWNYTVIPSHTQS